MSPKPTDPPIQRPEWVDHTEGGHRFVGFRWGWYAALWSGRQLMIYAGRVRPLSIGLPLERPSLRDKGAWIRIGCGPVAITWQPYRDLAYPPTPRRGAP